MKQMTNAPPGNKPVPDEQLWQKIQAFPLDDPHALLPFSRKLAREQHWHPAFTQRAITEYRRFLLLCCISPHGASPSHIIDQVWHLHLLYTKNYWEDLCAQTLQRSLHHYPSAGGSEQRDKHLAWRSDTLRLYRQHFAAEPPPDIWDDDHATKVPKPNILRRLTKTIRRCFLLVFTLLLSSCGDSGLFSPVPFFAFLVIAAIISQSRQANKPGDPHKKKNDKHCSSGDGCSGCSSDSSGCSGCGGGCGGCGGGGD